MQLEKVEMALPDDGSVKVSVQRPLCFERDKSDLLPEVVSGCLRGCAGVDRGPRDNVIFR